MCSNCYCETPGAPGMERQSKERAVYFIYIKGCQIPKLWQHNIYFQSMSLHRSYSYTITQTYQMNKHHVLYVILLNVCTVSLVGKAKDYI